MVAKRSVPVVILVILLRFIKILELIEMILIERFRVAIVIRKTVHVRLPV